MHEAYQAVAVIRKLPLQIESIAAYSDYLVLGTKQGHLLVYKMIQNAANSESKYEVELLRSNKSFAKKPITQINIVSEINLIIILSDGVVSAHDLGHFSFPLITSLAKTKGATLFAVDTQKQQSLTGEVQYTVRLCVARNRKLQLYYWKNRDFYELGPDLGIPEAPRAMTWCREKLCIGYKTDYSLISISEGTVKELFPTGKQMEPVITRLKNDNLALVKDEQTIFIDSEGIPTLKYPITWTELPVTMDYDQPYLISVLSSSIEVRTTDPRLLIQNIPLPKPRFIARCKSGWVFVASSCDVWCLDAVDIQQQIMKLLIEKQFELALHLSNNIDDTNTDKQCLMQRIQNMYAFDLFCKRKFQDAMDIFLKLGTDPSQVIGLFPDLLPEDYRSTLEYPDAVPNLHGTELENGLQGLIEYLLEVRKVLLKDLNLMMPLTAIVEGQKTIRSKKQLLQIIDTTLLKCYLQVNDALVSSLLRLADNNCHIEETERALKRHHKYSELIILYQCKGLHKKALELLTKQAKKSDSPLEGHMRTVQYLQHLGKENLNLIFEFSEWILKDHPEDGLKIFTEDLPETETLPRQDVLFFLNEKMEELVIPYLEHVIYDWSETSVLFHNTLIRKYCEKIQSLCETMAPMEMQETLRNKLRIFLEASTHYSAEMFPTLLLNVGLYEEAAIVMGRLERHEDAIAIYTHSLNDTQMAEEYCTRVYDKSKPDKQEVFFLLLKAYLSPSTLSLNFSSTAPKGEQKKNMDIPAALRVLKEHASKIDPEKALDLLPNVIKVQDIKQFLELVLQGRHINCHSTQLVKNLSLGKHIQVHAQRIKTQSFKVTIKDLTVCWVCQKRIGKIAFARFPNGVIVHYSCKEKYNSNNQQ